MKKRVLTIMSLALTIGALMPVNPVNAQEGTGVIYYDVESYVAGTLDEGDYYLSTDGTLADENYLSVEFPDTLSARVKVTGPLDTGDYEGKTEEGEGFPVDVIRADAQFDTCVRGHLFAPADEIVGGVQAWRYYCTGGAARDAGPYYLYRVNTTTYTKDDVKVTVKKELPKDGGVTTITADDIEVVIEKEVNGKVVSIPVKNIKFSDAVVDSKNGDGTITLLLQGVSSDFEMVIDVVEIANKKPEPTPEVKPSETKKSPKTGYTDPLIAMTGVGLAAVAACVILEVKKRSAKK